MIDDVAELLPIKLTPGFISIAFHLGCIGCNFCSVRYGNSRDRIFGAGVQRTYPTSPTQIAKLLASMPSFYKARVPIRLGNDTDLRFELEACVELLDLLPPDYPATALTRFPLTRDEGRRLGRPNLVVKLTATPASPYLTCPHNAEEVVESAHFFETPVLVTIGPVTADNFDATLRLLEMVPKKPNVAIYVKPLNDEFHPSLKQIPQITAAEYAQLRRAVAASGFRHVSQLMCPVYDSLRIRHKRVVDVPPDEQADCVRCSSYELCYAPSEMSLPQLHAELSTLGLAATDVPVQKGFKSYVIGVDRPAAFGDEAYLSEVFGCKVKLVSVRAGAAGGACAATREVLDRWDEVGFFPYRELIRLVSHFIEESIRAAEDGVLRHRLGPN